MKTKFKLLALSAIAASGALAGISGSQPKECSSLTMANVEALTDNENNTECRWKRMHDGHGCAYHICLSTGDGYSCECGAVD